MIDGIKIPKNRRMIGRWIGNAFVGGGHFAFVGWDGMGKVS
jgi:hypothetical protein